MTRRPRSGRWLWVGLLACLAGGCAHNTVTTPPVTGLPPLELPTGPIAPEDALAKTHSPNMLALSDEMRAFVDRYVRGDQRQRLQTLHRSLVSPAMAGVSYDPAADGTAEEVFHSGAANCLSYAHLFVAMARYAGLDAKYLSTSLRPEWSRHGNQIALRTHVNVTVRLHNGEQYVVDIDPVGRERIASSDVLGDDEALALYHGNLAMDALLDSDLPRAYAEALRAVSLGGNIDYLWINLGIIYRQAGQNAAAEAAYRTAPAINPDSRTAMNNMAALYNTIGETDKARAWEARVLERRERNPYYHYYLGERAEASGDLASALAHYTEAIALKDSEAEFYFRVARLYLAMQQHEQSRRYIVQAIDHARLVAERREYEAFLDKLDDGAVVTARLHAD
jgi:tetratricopeptide (TPR) repeat protein